MKASLERPQQRPNVAPPPQRNRTTTPMPPEIPATAPATTTVVSGPTAITDLFESHLDVIDRDLEKIPQKQSLTSKSAHTQTPITATVTDALILDPKISPPFTATITDTKVGKSSITTKRA